MLRPAGYFGAFLCPFDGAAGGGCRRPHCQYLHRASRRAEPWLAAGPSEEAGDLQKLRRIEIAVDTFKIETEEQKELSQYSLPGLSISSIAKEDENSKQPLAKPTEVFPCERQDRNSKLSPFRRHVFTKRSRNSSPVELEGELQESDDECDLVIDVPPLIVNKKPRIKRDCKNLNSEGKDAVICVEKVHGSAVAGVPGYTAEKSEKMVALQENDKCLNESEKVGNVSLKASNIYFPNANTDILKISKHRNILACTMGKHASSAASTESDVQKEILKQENAESDISVKAFVQEHTTNENCVGSQKVTQSVLCTSHLSGEEAATERPCKQLVLNTEKSHSTEENGGNDSPEDTYPYLTDFLNVGKEAYSVTVLQTKNGDKNSSVETAGTNKKESEVIQSSSAEEMESSGEDPELSESDDPIEECRRIFYEFEREAQKKDSDKQTYGENVDVNLLETKVDVAGQKRRIAHMAKFDVHNKNEMVPFKGSPLQQSPDARVCMTQWKALTASVATDFGQKKPMSKLSATQVQSIRSAAFLNLLEVQPIETSSGQPRILLEGNAEIAMPCRVSVTSFERTALMPCKESTQKKPSILESASKVPHETRIRYVRVFCEEYLKICSTENEAISKALVEEQSVYDRCGSKNMYLNFAVKTLKKLRDHGQFSDITSHRGAGSVKPEEEKEFTGGVLYELLKDYLLTEQQLNENNFPRPNPERNGSAVFNGVTKKAVSDDFKRACCRCGEVFTVTSSGKHRRKEECSYHSGRVLEQKVPGGLEKCYSCCEGIVGSAGCQIAKLHVHDGRKEKLEGFVRTLVKSPPFDGNYGVYALDCEMCYTTQGMELTRVTVVNAKLQVVYDTFVKPDGEVVDYNIRFSGVTEDDLKNTTTSLRDVQAILLNLFSADTILIGHGLENDLFALKLIHDTVVDTSLIFPHRLGLPHKRALKSLMADHLMRISQDDVGGHNSSEDAIACMELILWKVKEDNKRRK